MGRTSDRIYDDASQETQFAAQQVLMRNEGYRQTLYSDTEGIPTVGFGRNLRTRGVDITEATYLLDRDIRDAMRFLSSYAFWNSLNMPRRVALIDLCVNLGAERFQGFHKMLGWLDLGKYAAAANEMRRSLADHQEPARIDRDAMMLETGEMPL